jgi:hypothetical protein
MMKAETKRRNRERPSQKNKVKKQKETKAT